MRVFAVSDLHVDQHAANRAWLDALSAGAHQSDTLIVAGDVSHDLETLRSVLAGLRDRFACVTFVPGNHELWLRRGECADSLEKFWRVVEVCREIGVATAPVRCGRDGAAVWLVPLYGWYAKPEEGHDSLFLPKPGEDPTLGMWADNAYVSWPEAERFGSPAEHFLSLNEPAVTRSYDAPVISFSHFLPRRDLIFPAPGEGWAGGAERRAERRFNFSRVAGTAGLERQLRRLPARVHVYGHQHRNRRRALDGVLYLSHCLGYPRERRRGQLPGLDAGPALVWDAAATPAAPHAGARRPHKT